MSARFRPGQWVSVPAAKYGDKVRRVAIITRVSAGHGRSEVTYEVHITTVGSEGQVAWYGEAALRADVGVSW